MNSFTRSKSKEEIKAFQEEKNLNDFIYQTNTKLQSLSQGLIALSLNLEKLKLQFQKENKDLEIQLENLKEQVLKETDDMGHLITDQASLSIEFIKKSHKKFKEIEDGYVHSEQLDNLYAKLRDKHDEIDKKLAIEKAYIDSSLLLLNGQINDKIVSLRTDLTPAPPKSDPIKDALDERLNPIQIDFKGLVKEIELLKKAVKYSDKKFEQIYTLIERLKEGDK